MLRMERSCCAWGWLRSGWRSRFPRHLRGREGARPPDQEPDRARRRIEELQCRAAENTVYFASVNCAMPNQSAATSLVDPEGTMMSHVPYGKEDLLVANLDLTRASRFLARRYNPKLYPA